MKQPEISVSQLLDWIPSPVFIVDTASVISRCNRSAASFLGFKSKEQAAGRKLIDFYRHPEDWQLLVQRLYREQEVSEFEVMYTSESKAYSVAVESSHITADEQIVIIGRDISQRVKLQHELMSTNMELMETNAQLHVVQTQLAQEKSMASLGTLAAGMAHELNNPLSYIQTNFRTALDYFQELGRYITDLEQLAGERGSSEADIRELRKRFDTDTIFTDIEDIRIETERGFRRMNEIIQGLSIFTEAKTEQSEKVSVQSALHTAILLTQADRRESVHLNTEIDALPPVKGSTKELVQAFHNLLLNAIEAAENTEQARGQIQIRAHADEDWVYCDFINNGPEIPPEHQSRLFDPFFTTKEVGQGSGLGLTAVYQVVMHIFGGSISLRSASSTTCFTVRLPHSL
ncbi:MAG: sensor histidine kinase [Spirochaetota bacterium]